MEAYARVKHQKLRLEARPGTEKREQPRWSLNDRFYDVRGGTKKWKLREQMDVETTVNEKSIKKREKNEQENNLLYK
jgi:hypothetical protein